MRVTATFSTDLSHETASSLDHTILHASISYCAMLLSSVKIESRFEYCDIISNYIQTLPPTETTTTTLQGNDNLDYYLRWAINCEAIFSFGQIRKMFRRFSTVQ